MKKTVSFLSVIWCMTVSLPAFSQKYKSASDTVKLNKEWVHVNNDIAELTAKLTIAQNNLPGYHSKSEKAVSDAQGTAQASSEQAQKATNGDLGDAKNARKKAKKALNDAEKSSDAKDDVTSQEHKIDKLTAQLQQKQKTLNELEDMRTTIRAMHQ